MKDSIALLIIGGIIMSVSVVLLLLHYIIPGAVLLGVASILLVSGLSLMKILESPLFNRRSRV